MSLLADCTMAAIERICSRNDSDRFFTSQVTADSEVAIIRRCSGRRANDISLKKTIGYALSYFCNNEGSIRRIRRGEYELNSVPE